MFISKDHYHWLINVNPAERVAAQRQTDLVLITKMQTENYMLQEKIGELNVLVRRLERQVADKDMRDYGVDSKWGQEAQKMAVGCIACGEHHLPGECPVPPRDPKAPFIQWRDPTDYRVDEHD